MKESVVYAKVSRKELWNFVDKELGLNLEVSPLVKLVHYKYLNYFEMWAKKIFEEKILRNENKSVIGVSIGYRERVHRHVMAEAKEQSS